MNETLAEELLRQIRETDNPDKKRYARVKVLASQLCTGIDEPKQATALNSAFRSAYLDLQIALLHNTDSALLDLYKTQCNHAVSKMCAAGRIGSAHVPHAGSL